MSNDMNRHANNNDTLETILTNSEEQQQLISELIDNNQQKINDLGLNSICDKVNEQVDVMLKNINQDLENAMNEVSNKLDSILNANK